MVIDLSNIVEVVKSAGLFIVLVAMLGAGFHYTSKNKKGKGGGGGSSDSSSSSSSNNDTTS